MNAVAPECSSGCESGWTLYLDQSFLSPNTQKRGSTFVRGRRTHREYEHGGEEREEGEEEEDLSMVSDASSGPPHFREDDDDCSNDDNGCFYPSYKPAATALPKTARPLPNKCCERRRSRRREDVRPMTEPSPLDDTASSPAFEFSKSNEGLTHSAGSTGSMLDCSHGFSATHFEEKSTFQDHFGFLQPSFPENLFQRN